MLAKKSKKLLSLLMALAMTATLLPATAFADEAMACGKEAHAHTDPCYTQELVCALGESEGHTHGEDCYTDGEPVLSCGNEDPDHIHGPECSVPGEPIVSCGIDASEGHTHTEACYKSVLTCTQEEHEHSEDCAPAPFMDVMALNEATSDITVGEYHLMNRDSFYNYCLDEVQRSLKSGHKASAMAITGTQIVAQDGRKTNWNVMLQEPNLYNIEAEVGNGTIQPDEVKEIVFSGTYAETWKPAWFFVRSFEVRMPADLFVMTKYPANGNTEAFAEVYFETDPDAPEITEYTIIFDDNLPNRAEAPEQPYAVAFAESGNAIAAQDIPEDPMFDGYQFLGWYLDDDSDKFNFDTQITGDITLTAKWEEDADKGDTVTLIIQYNHENNGGGNDGKGGHDGPATQEELEKVVAGARVKLGDGYDDTIANTVVEVNISDGKNGTTSAITLTLYKDALGENGKFDLSVAGFAPAELLRGCKLKGGNTTANFNGNTVEKTMKLLYKCSDIEAPFNGITVQFEYVTPEGKSAVSAPNGVTKPNSKDISFAEGDSTVLFPETNFGIGDHSGYTFHGWYDNAECEGDVLTKENPIGPESPFMAYGYWTKDPTIPPAGDKTTVSVWHYYGANAYPVAGAPVDAQSRDSELITEDWVNGLKSMEFYTGEDADCYQYTGFEIYTLADGAEEYQPVDAIGGHVDLTGLKSVAVHLAYDEKAFAPIVYHSNFGTDATKRVLVEKGGASTYPDHTVLGYGETGLTSRSGYTFQGWSTTAAGAASISAGTAQSVTSAGLEFYAVWSPNGGGNPPSGGDDRPDRPSRPTVTPPVEEEVILPEEVPLGDAPITDAPVAGAEGETVVTPPEDGADYAIVDADVPLGNLPQTGTAAQAVDPAWTLGLLALAASMAAAGLAVTITRKREDEI